MGLYGWKLHIACTVAGVWIPLAARLTPANVADSEVAPRLVEELPEEARYVLLKTYTTTHPRCGRCAKKMRIASW